MYPNSHFAEEAKDISGSIGTGPRAKKLERDSADSHLSLPEPGRLPKQRFRKTNESQKNFIHQLTTQSIELKEFTDVTIWGPQEELQHD